MCVTVSPCGPISHSLPPLPALSLHVVETFLDPSRIECLLFGPRSHRAIFSHFLPPSFPAPPAFSLHAFMTFCNPFPYKNTYFWTFFHHFPIPELPAVPRKCGWLARWLAGLARWLAAGRAGNFCRLLPTGGAGNFALVLRGK